MSQKGKKRKPTRKEIDNAIQGIWKSMQFIGEKLNYLDSIVASVEKGLELYIKFKGDEKKFMKEVKEYNEKQAELEKKEKEKVAKKEETS